MELHCPSCSKAMLLHETSKYNYADGTPRKFWSCRECKITHSAHPDGRPVGVPANKETRDWRRTAHDSFNRTWKQWGYSKGKAYILLQSLMGMNQDDAHIGRFTIEQCKELIFLLDNMPEVQNPECLKKKDFISTLKLSVLPEKMPNEEHSIES